MKSTLLTKGLVPLFTLSILLFTQCKEDDSDNDAGSVQVEITDAPIDDENIEGAFVTIVDVKIDGESMSDFTGKQTIDLLAYQRGEVKSLGTGVLEAGAYNNVTLVLDYEKDASGNAPGCYVLTKDGTKHALKSSSNTSSEITATESFQANQTGRTNLVFDFDVRKAVAYSNSGSSQYQFTSDAELSAAVRVVKKAETGTVRGNCNNPLTTSDRIVVYAYEKGTFNAATEKQGPVQFKNAVTSAVVDDQGNYTLSFLEDGDYELQFIGYNDSNSDGKMELQGSLLLNVLGALNLNNISVAAQTTVTLDVVVTGILPL